MTFRQFLELKFLEWQQKSGGRKTVEEFAKYLGIGRTAVSNWWSSDRTPQGENVQKIALKLGMEVYDVLGLERPDEDLYAIQQNWDYLTPEERRSFRESVEQHASIVTTDQIYGRLVNDDVQDIIASI